MAAVKLEGLEKLLIEGLAEYSDARGALRMHLFDKDADISLKTQLQNRLVGTAFGELLTQRFERLENPELEPDKIGASSLFSEADLARLEADDDEPDEVLAPTPMPTLTSRSSPPQASP